MRLEDTLYFPPDIWFALLCEQIALDQERRINFGSVFNIVRYHRPPPTSNVPPHADLRGVLAIGFGRGLGKFKVGISLRDVDDRVLWQRPEPWEFTLGPDNNGAAVFGEPVQYWFAEPGEYYFRLELSPGVKVVLVPFEVKEQSAPSPQLRSE